MGTAAMKAPQTNPQALPSVMSRRHRHVRSGRCGRVPPRRSSPQTLTSCARVARVASCGSFGCAFCWRWNWQRCPRVALRVAWSWWSVAPEFFGYFDSVCCLSGRGCRRGTTGVEFEWLNDFCWLRVAADCRVGKDTLMPSMLLLAHATRFQGPDRPDSIYTTSFAPRSSAADNADTERVSPTA